ncbi:hypothetical protein EC912_101436 [Luteibacter rhizovicinus]|uniref:Uncharacterized protein n=1 Tax=Luteibacter rhizovicinus TaxID=242606 RepID=A0A4R3Z0S4_9GAMM|nr:hypothetical protein EC912_101436 [Luteibacter rhizovicinus]
MRSVIAIALDQLLSSGADTSKRRGKAVTGALAVPTSRNRRTAFPTSRALLPGTARVPDGATELLDKYAKKQCR